MNTTATPTTKDVIELLIRNYGPLETARIIREMRTGAVRDYTAERHKWLGEGKPVKKPRKTAPKRKSSRKAVAV